MAEVADSTRASRNRASRELFATRQREIGHVAAVDELTNQVADGFRDNANACKQIVKLMCEGESSDDDSLFGAPTRGGACRKRGFRSDAPFRITSEPSPGLFWVEFDDVDADGRVSEGLDLQDEASCGPTAVAQYRASLAGSVADNVHEFVGTSGPARAAPRLEGTLAPEEFPLSQDSLDHMVTVDGVTGILPGDSASNAS